MVNQYRQQNQQKNNVRTLQNDYVRASDEKLQYLKRQKVLFRRRIFAFAIVATIILAFLITTIFTQDQRIAKKQQEKEEVLANLEEVLNQQELLKLQIAKLEDDEYIAKLARKELLFSEEGEIIFTIPKED